ncbi:hypothetical protein DFJ73DRAFT_800432 [Zopfochytrium polystomum]|nr:hypothetical protein DFJ73DRAFT_800432 [Zopfochytrium polystomum]
MLTSNDGAEEAVWPTMGFSFKSTNGLKNFVVHVNSSSIGVVVAEPASCEAGAVWARPFGRNSEYPPHAAYGTLEGGVVGQDRSYSGAALWEQF